MVCVFLCVASLAASCSVLCSRQHTIMRMYKKKRRTVSPGDPSVLVQYTQNTLPLYSDQSIAHIYIIYAAPKHMNTHERHQWQQKRASLI